MARESSAQNFSLWYQINFLCSYNLMFQHVFHIKFIFYINTKIGKHVVRLRKIIGFRAILKVRIRYGKENFLLMQQTRKNIAKLSKNHF